MVDLVDLDQMMLETLSPTRPAVRRSVQQTRKMNGSFWSIREVAGNRIVFDSGRCRSKQQIAAKLPLVRGDMRPQAAGRVFRKRTFAQLLDHCVRARKKRLR